MKLAAFTILIALVLIGIMLVAILTAQIWLAKKENKWLGLILPAVFFLLALFVTFSSISFERSSVSVEERAPDGLLISSSALSAGQQNISVSAVASSLMLFLYVNIPTIVLMIIYIFYRKCLKKNKETAAELQKMNIQDLE